MEFKYQCPHCKKFVIYKTIIGYNRAVENNKLCRVCLEKERNLDLHLVRNCPKCNIELTYKYKSDWTKANKQQSCCQKCMTNSGQFQKDHKLNEQYNVSQHNLNKLLEETPQSFYWLGFIIADGSFYIKTSSRNKNGIIFELGLKESDVEHLKNFGNFINYSNIKYRNSTKSYRISFSNINNKILMNKYGLLFNKTYNSIDFEKFFKKYNNKLLLSLLIGIIDGDGHISYNGKGCSIEITSHKNWETFYRLLCNKLGLNFNFTYPNLNILRISKTQKSVLKQLYEFAKNNNLPVLERKWNRIKEKLYENK